MRRRFAIRRQAIMTPVLFALLILIPFRFLWNARSGVLDKLSAVETQQAATRARAQQARLAQQKQGEYLGTLQTLQQAMPADPQLAEILDDLTTIANQAGARLTAAEPGTPLVPTAPSQNAAPGQVIAPPPPGQASSPTQSSSSGRAGMTLIPVRVSIAGPAPNVYKFFELLRTKSRLYVADVPGFSYGQDGQFLATVAIYAYTWHSPYTPAPDPTDSGPTATGTTATTTTTTTTTPSSVTTNTTAVVTPIIQPVTREGSCVAGQVGYRGIFTDGGQARCRQQNGAYLWVAESW